MRRLIGGMMMLAGAYALYWAYKGAGGHLPANYSFTNPVIQYGVIGALAFMVGYAVIRGYRKPLLNIMACPGCGKTIQKGRRNCPFCKEQLIHY